MTTNKPNLLGKGGRKRVPCLCSFCATLFHGYQRWVARGFQQCPGCHLNGTGFVRELNPEQIRLVLNNRRLKMKNCAHCKQTIPANDPALKAGLGVHQKCVEPALASVECKPQK